MNDALLAPYAAHEAGSRGRRTPEEPPQYRSEYQRDRDRIIHSAAFRRLEYKTQVFVNYEGDLFRTRLTHSLEVAQISRSVALALQLNETLCEAIALAHDLGHTPFGHAGQAALNACMRPFGGFEHNSQSLRIVDFLEQHYAAFDGLNLTFETREGILKHCAPSKARELGDLGARFLHGGQPSLEAQLVNLADEIAYNHHDLDDALRAGLVSLDDLDNLPLVAIHYRQARAEWPQVPLRRLRHDVIRRLINAEICDLIETSRARLAVVTLSSSDAVRAHPQPLIGLSENMGDWHRQLKHFLHSHMYQHYRVHRMAAKAEHIITRLFEAFIDDPRLLPPEPRQHISRHAASQGENSAGAQAVADYIAGMTDRYAILEYERLFNMTALP
jgi:dGTPase